MCTFIQDICNLFGLNTNQKLMLHPSTGITDAGVYKQTA